METKTYNGWTNYETWCVKLWMDNEEGSYRYWKDQAEHIWKRARGNYPFTRREQAERTLAESLKDEFTEAMPEVEGVWQDLLTTALGETNWDEIAASLLEDEEDDEEEEAEDDDSE